MDHWLQDFRQTLDSATGRLVLISETDSAIPTVAGKWSPKEIIGHLIDSAGKA